MFFSVKIKIWHLLVVWTDDSTSVAHRGYAIQLQDVLYELPHGNMYLPVGLPKPVIKYLLVTIAHSVLQCQYVMAHG